MATIWSVLLNRMDKVGQKFWTEWRANVVEQGPAQEGDIPMIGPGGVIDPSLLPGIAGTNVLVTTVTANQTINAFQVVSVHSDGLVYLADVTNVQDASQTIGIAITSALAGNTLKVQQLGFLSNLGWNWPTPGQTLYLGIAGTLTTTVPLAPAATFELPIATAISNTEIEVQIGLPIVLS